MMRMMLGRMFLRSLWMRPLSPCALVVTKARPPGVSSRASRATQASHRISMVSPRRAGSEEGEEKKKKEEEVTKKEEAEVLPGPPRSQLLLVSRLASTVEREKEKGRSA